MGRSEAAVNRAAQADGGWSVVRHLTRAGTSLVLLGCTWLVAGCAASGPFDSGLNNVDAAQFNAELGAKYLQRGELDQARQKLEKSLQQDADNALAHITYARLQQSIEEYEVARTHFKKALDLQPDDAGHRNSYGVFLCEIGDVNPAVEQFKAAASNPFYKTPEFALDNAGLCLLDEERLQDAEIYLRDALRKNPRFANALLHMADLTYRKQQLAIASAYLGRFENYSRPTAASLQLGMNIRKADGDVSGAQTYANRLVSEFPQSREAGDYLLQPL